MKHLFCYFAPPIWYMIYRCAMLGEQNHTLTVLIWFLLECVMHVVRVLRHPVRDPVRAYFAAFIYDNNCFIQQHSLW